MLRKIYLLAESILAVIIAGWLVVSATEIYTDGLARKISDPLERIYTREVVSEKLAPIVPLFVIFAVLTSAGLIAGVHATAKNKINRDFMLSRPRKFSKTLQILLLIAAVGFIVAGVFNGSARDVLYKAVNICTECVGLG